MVLRLPDILAEIIPVAALLAGLLAFAELARHSELTAIYAGGMSKVRLALAIVPVVVLISGFQLLIEDQAQPVAMKELRAWGVGDYARDEARATWLRRDADILRIEKIDPGQVELHGLTIFRRDADGNLIAKIDAVRAVFEDGSWTLYDVARSEITSATVEKLRHMAWSGDVAPGDLDLLITSPAEMPLRELLRVVDDPELGSQPAYRYATWLHERIAGPVTTAMLLLLTVAIARPPRGRATPRHAGRGGDRQRIPVVDVRQSGPEFRGPGPRAAATSRLDTRAGHCCDCRVDRASRPRLEAKSLEYAAKRRSPSSLPGAAANRDRRSRASGGRRPRRRGRIRPPGPGA